MKIKIKSITYNNGFRFVLMVGVLQINVSLNSSSSYLLIYISKFTRKITRCVGYTNSSNINYKSYIERLVYFKLESLELK